MKILTVREPWATLIIRGGKAKNGRFAKKDIENRKRATKVRGRIAIHAGKSREWLRDDLEDVKDRYDLAIEEEDCTFGSVIGSVELIDCTKDSASKWYDGDEYWGFVLARPFAYPRPIPCKGQLGFFTNEEIARRLARYERLRVAD